MMLQVCKPTQLSARNTPVPRAFHNRSVASAFHSAAALRNAAVRSFRRSFCSQALLPKHTCAIASPICKNRRIICQAAAATPAAGKDSRMPVTVITGFLGSGKTTLLNHLLTQNHGRRIAVIENEFGEVDIDSDLVAKQELLEGTTDSITKLNNGCLCCVMRDDLVKVLNKLYRRRSEFDHIVIETTGLANPAPIINSFYMDQDLLERMRLDGVVTLVDAFNVERHLDEVKPQDVVNESVEQIAYADRVILNKTDLVSSDKLRQLESRIRAINELASIQRAQRGQVPVDYVLGVGGFDLSRIDEQMDADAKAGHTHSHSHEHDHDHDHECSPGCTHESHSHSHDHDHGHDHGHAHSEHSSNGEAHSHAHDHDHAHAHSHDHDHDCSGADCKHESHKHSQLQEMKHDDRVSSVSLVLEGEFDLDKVNFCLGTLLSERSEDIFRMKGILAIQGLEERFVYHAVHQLFEGAPDRKWLPGEPRINKMVFIGRYLNKEDFEFAFQQCIVKSGPVEVEVLN